MLVERGVDVTYETVRQWAMKFGIQCTRRLKRRQGRLGDTWHLDELFASINGTRQYLWRAVDQDGDMIDILVQPRWDAAAARRFVFGDGAGLERWESVLVNRCTRDIWTRRSYVGARYDAWEPISR